MSLEQHPDVRETRSLTVSAIYGSERWTRFLLQAALFSAYAISDAKLKLTGDSKRDGARAYLLSRVGKVRLDANNLWRDSASARIALSALRPYAWAVEEPIQPRDWEGMLQLAHATGLSMILDESVRSLRDLDAVPAGANFILNLRVSKLGGLARTLHIDRKSVV